MSCIQGVEHGEEKPGATCHEQFSQRLTGNPLVIGTSILKMRTRALNRVQTLMGSLGSQNTQPTLQERTKKSNKQMCLDIKVLNNYPFPVQ